MESAIIFITVLFSTVDLIFSDIRCYECQNSYEPACSDPVLKTCSSDQNFCLKNTKERGDEKSIYRCFKVEDSWPCSNADHVCTVCEYDGCNKPGKNGKEHKLRKCYQCYDSANQRPKIFSMITSSCENPSKVFCGVDQECMWATGRGEDKNVYCGCTVLPATEVCSKYKFFDCRTCDDDLCNVPKGFIEMERTCYECYTGDTASEANKYFRGMPTCDNPSKTKCGFLRSCLRGVDKIGGRKYYGCFDEDKSTCEKFNFKACKLCDGDLCNEIRDYPSDDLVQCYECYSGKKNEEFENLASCSYPAVKLCDAGSKCLRATDKNKTMIYHSCFEKNQDYDLIGFDNVTSCKPDLCNKVPEDETSLQSYNCYECYLGDTYANMKNMPPCSKPILKQCELGFKCLEASSNDKTQRYFGCADGNKSCKELSGLDDCQFCEENGCNQIKPIIDQRKRIICYDCYTLPESERQGTTPEDPNFVLRHKPNCSNASIIRCPLGKHCASAYGRRGRFHGCVSDPKLDCINYGFSECDTYCKEDLCNTVDAAENGANVTGLIQIKSSASAMSNSGLLIILIVLRTAL